MNVSVSVYVYVSVSVSVFVYVSVSVSVSLFICAYIYIYICASLPASAHRLGACDWPCLNLWWIENLYCLDHNTSIPLCDCAGKGVISY